MSLDPMPDWVLSRRREIGERIRSARRTANLTQARLGELIGRDHRTIHRWEYATRIPDLADLLLIADAVRVPLAELVREPPSADGPRTGPGSASPRREA